MSGIRELLEAGDADLRANLGEPVVYTPAGAAQGVQLVAVLSPLPEALELNDLGGPVVVSTAQAVVSKSALVTRPHAGDRVDLADGRRYIVNSETAGSWDTSWHLLLRLANE